MLDAVAYSFGRQGGLIDVSFDEQVLANTRRDRLVVGFRSALTEHGAATTGGRLLARVVSATSNDFVELSLVRLSSFYSPRYLLVARNRPFRYTLVNTLTYFRCISPCKAVAMVTIL